MPRPSTSPICCAGGCSRRCASAVIVSATLTVGNSFAYVERRLGLEMARGVALGSPFDFERAALLYVPNDLPDPNEHGYQESLESVLADLIARTGGRTLVLFTSRAQLRASYLALRAPLRAAGVTVLGQDLDHASRTQLLDQFRRGERVALFGTSSFWEGIDVVGDALCCVVLARLPFAVPTDPIYTARAEQFEQPFAEFALPHAVLRLKQGFGRLIRSRTDRGVVVVLDRRLVTRRYGRVFVDSLPPCSVEQGPSRRTGRRGHRLAGTVELGGGAPAGSGLTDHPFLQSAEPMAKHPRQRPTHPPRPDCLRHPAPARTDERLRRPTAGATPVRDHWMLRTDTPHGARGSTPSSARERREMAHGSLS